MILREVISMLLSSIKKAKLEKQQINAKENAFLEIEKQIDEYKEYINHKEYNLAYNYAQEFVLKSVENFLSVYKSEDDINRIKNFYDSLNNEYGVLCLQLYIYDKLFDCGFITIEDINTMHKKLIDKKRKILRIIDEKQNEVISIAKYFYREYNVDLVDLVKNIINEKYSNSIEEVFNDLNSKYKILIKSVDSEFDKIKYIHIDDVCKKFKKLQELLFNTQNNSIKCISEEKEIVKLVYKYINKNENSKFTLKYTLMFFNASCLFKDGSPVFNSKVYNIDNFNKSCWDKYINEIHTDKELTDLYSFYESIVNCNKNLDSLNINPFETANQENLLNVIRTENNIVHFLSYVKSDELFLKAYEMNKDLQKTFRSALEIQRNFDKISGVRQGFGISDPKALIQLRYEEITQKTIFTGAVEKLNSFIGMDNIKREIDKLAKYQKVEKMKIERGLADKHNINLHLVFTGNPGTGKTTVARIIADLYYGLGLLPTNNCIEVDRENLVGEHVGSTALKTKKIVEKALGGVLFIDEAYTLSSSESRNDFGKEAIDELLKLMEDNRENLCVIVAGYQNEMEHFISSNPGLKSRFNRYINFEDYTSNEMVKIIESIAKGYLITKESEELLNDYYKKLINQDKIDNKHFANARQARNDLEKLKEIQSLRISGFQNADELTNNILMTFTADDIKTLMNENLI